MKAIQHTNQSFCSNIQRMLGIVVMMVMMSMVASAHAQTSDKYYALHKDSKGYMKQCKGIVNNDGTFRYENAYDGNGFSIWVYSSDGFLQNEMYYLNVLNGQTLVLSTTPLTQWDLVEDGDKQRFQMANSSKILGLDANNKVVISENPANKYAACELTVTEENNKWEGPKDIDFTVQSPQLVTYLRTYFVRNITVIIIKNDAGNENVKVVDKKDSRSYCTRTFIPGNYDGQGTKWEFDNTTQVIYKITTSNSNETATANYNIAPVDPITCSSHPAIVQSCKTTIKPKAFSPASDKKYLIFNTQENNYRFPKENSSLVIGDLLPVNGKQANLTEEINGDISWEPIADNEGYFSFKNVATNRYFYYDANDYTVSNYGAMKIGDSQLPENDNRYKFKLCTAGNRDPYGSCLYIVPYEKQFACVKDGSFIEELYFAVYVTSSGTRIASLYKASDNAKWKLYKYEWQYRLWDNYSIIGDQGIYTAGDHTYTASTWFSRNITESPSNSDYCTLPGSKTHDGIGYTWELTGLDDYIEMNDALASGTSTLTATVTLPPGTRTGTLKVTAKITTPASLSNNKTIPLTLYNLNPTFTEIGTLSQITNVNGLYKLTADNTYSSTDNKPAVATFSGTLDGDGHTISGIDQPLFETLAGGTVRNLNFNNVTIPSGTNVGTVCGEANGAARIYNVGILGGSISGTNYVGGLVGKLDGEARVVNCFSYANIIGGTDVGGIVGYNNVETKSNNLKTMVFGCMFYGDITGGTNKAPIYNGKIITNRGDQSGVSNFNYFCSEASYVQGDEIDIQTYNCALAAEGRFLNRFEFFRHLLNGRRELAGWWATGIYSSNEMYKWVMIPDSIGTSHPYPVLKEFGRYPSLVNIDAEHATTGKPRNQGGKLGELTVNIQMGDGAVYNHPGTGDNEAKITTSQLTLNITDKDTTHFNFNYYKVQLPYYNDVGTKNYTGNRVVAGWKIVKINGSTTGTGTYDTGENVTYDANGNLTKTPYNFADRHCTNKDLYSVSKRVFNQGAYWDVPDGVTSITIEPYWAKCVYLADQNADKVYDKDMGTGYDVPNVGGGQIYTNGNSYPIAEENQKVFTSKSNAIATSNSGLFQGVSAGNHTVYDYAVVLVGNYHFYGDLDADMSKPYTVTSIDLDGDNEPDYSYILRFDSRKKVHPVRVDFINIPGLGMAQKSHQGTGTYNFGIMQPKGWFESTNTSLFRETQFEYDNSDRVEAPYILHGGVMEQWVSGQSGGAANKTPYFYVGGNVWFKEFHRGTHQDKTLQSKHPPVSVTGGDYDQFYLTGLYTANVTSYEDNAECYINGGRFGMMAGAGMEGIGKASNNTGNITWLIDNADIKEFYAGGINAANGKTVAGNLHTIINNSHVDLFCGGPKFGDMTNNRTVVTTATDCTFGFYFGAGYGGNSYSRYPPYNYNNKINIEWNKWVNGEMHAMNGNTDPDPNYEGFQHHYSSTYDGVDTQIDYQFIPMSGNKDNCARLWIEYVKFSLATTHSVTSTLTGCTIDNSFYGGGSLGKVDGPVVSVLDGCTVKGNVFGAGYSATLPKIPVMNKGGFIREPHYDENLGAFLPKPIFPDTVEFRWEHANTVNSTETAISEGNKILYTTENLSKSNLGSVSGNVELTLKGNTIVGTLENGTLKPNTGNVYGGGDESHVTKRTGEQDSGNTTVKLQQGAQVLGNVYGGGNNGPVEGDSQVIIQDETNTTNEP